MRSSPRPSPVGGTTTLTRIGKAKSSTSRWGVLRRVMRGDQQDREPVPAGAEYRVREIRGASQAVLLSKHLPLASCICPRFCDAGERGSVLCVSSIVTARGQNGPPRGQASQTTGRGCKDFVRGFWAGAGSADHRMNALRAGCPSSVGSSSKAQSADWPMPEGPRHGPCIMRMKPRASNSRSHGPTVLRWTLSASAACRWLRTMGPLFEPLKRRFSST